jgi:hypothetical protein
MNAKVRSDFDTGHLSGEAAQVANTVLAICRQYHGLAASGGGCRAFYTPEEWMERGEQYGLSSVLIICHDGGDMAPFFNSDYEAYGWMEVMDNALRKEGFWAEPCTSWYTAVYRA